MDLRQSIDVDQLFRMARDKSAASRTDLVETISDLFFGGGERLSDRERALMTDILRQLIHDVEMTVRKRLAERLAHRDDAPRDLVATLANDEIEVAHPILVYSEVLLDSELVEIITHRTMEHQLAIAMRRSLSESVSDALVHTGNETVVVKLLENDSALISGATMAYLVEQSKRFDSYQNPLVHRSNLSPDLAKRLYWWVSAALRKHILENFEIDPSDLDDEIEHSVTEILETGGAAGRQRRVRLTGPAGVARRLDPARALGPAVAAGRSVAVRDPARPAARPALDHDQTPDL